jgi:hypothetical protein
MSDAALLAAFIDAFSRHDEMLATIPSLHPDVHALRLGKPGRFGERWRPKRVRVGPRALAALYERLPFRLPRLYELLISSDRWAEVEIGACALLANPPGPALIGLADQIFRDTGLTDTLIPNGFLPFARGADGNYDPVCFASRRSAGQNDSPVVQLDHEDILCDRRIKVVSELAPSFRALVEQSIASAASA